jgi:hypothetical protein
MNDFEMIQTSFSAMRLTKDMIIAKSSGFDLDSVFNLSLAKLRKYSRFFIA